MYFVDIDILTLKKNELQNCYKIKIKRVFSIRSLRFNIIDIIIQYIVKVVCQTNIDDRKCLILPTQTEVIAQLGHLRLLNELIEH